MSDLKRKAWQVAAALLLLEEHSLHYTYLTQEILETGLTDLAMRGGETPEKTVRTIVGSQHPDLFMPRGDGEYSVVPNAALARGEVRVALHAILEIESRRMLEALATALSHLQGSSEEMGRRQPRGYHTVEIFERRLRCLSERMKSYGGW